MAKDFTCVIQKLQQEHDIPQFKYQLSLKRGKSIKTNYKTHSAF